MDDLLKEAIADAKAVRETALENAKMALEEAFTPRLQNMLSQKIQNEIEDEDDEKKDEAMDDEDDIEEREDDEDMEERAMNDEDEDPSDEHSEEEMDESEIIEIDGVKYAPVVSEEEDEEDEEEMDEIDKEDDEDMEEDLDLESVIKELESELDEAEEVEESKEEVEEQSKSSGIGAGDNKVSQVSASDEEDPGKGKLKEGEDKDDKEVDEDIDLDEVLAALSEEEDEDEKKDEVKELKSDLEEHRSVIETLREKLNEVNLLNAKLLFTNKLFRKHGLNNEQKMKVVEQFDRASNLREVKLVYSTLGESFGARKNEINESKGAASKPIASTKPEKEVITESSDLRDRFKKLANLI